jgi:hypothetical protein
MKFLLWCFSEVCAVAVEVVLRQRWEVPSPLLITDRSAARELQALGQTEDRDVKFHAFQFLQ